MPHGTSYTSGQTPDTSGTHQEDHRLAAAASGPSSHAAALGPPVLVDARLPYLQTTLRGVLRGFAFGFGTRSAITLAIWLIFKRRSKVGLIEYMSKPVKLHAIGLALFGGLYKLLRAVLRDVRGRPYHDPTNTFMIGGVLGSIILGNDLDNSREFLYYVLRYIAETLVNMAYEALHPRFPKLFEVGRRVIAFVLLGMTFMLYENNSHHMRRSFVRVMQFIYHDALPSSPAHKVLPQAPSTAAPAAASETGTA